MSLIAIPECRHSLTAHLFENPFCEEQTLLLKIMSVVFHILTLGIPLAIYHLIACCFLEASHETPTPSIRDAAVNSVIRIYRDPLPPQNGDCLFQAKKLGKDLILQIAIYLLSDERAILGRTSKAFKKLMADDILWNFDWNKKWNRAQTVESNSLTAITTQISLRLDKLEYRMKKAELRDKCWEILQKFPYCFNYLAHRIVDGIVSFDALPNLDLSKIPNFIFPAENHDPIEGVKIADMSAPVMKGKDNFNRTFLAMCLIDKGRQDARPTVLVLVSRFYNPKEWIHAANDYWLENQIESSNQTHQCAIVSIINGDAPNPSLPGVSNQIQLYRPERNQI